MARVSSILIFVCLALILTSVDLAAGSIQNEDIAGMWLFDEGSGDTADDSSGNGNDGEIFEAEWNVGRFGKALKFDGVSSYVNCGMDTSLDITDNLTIVAWIKEDGEQTGWPRVVARENAGAGHRQYALCYSNAQEIRAIADTEGGAFCDIIGPELNGDWHHLAATYSDQTMELFLDGVSVGKSEGSGSLVSEGEIGNVAIGKTAHGALQDFFRGTIDEVAIFSVALNKDEINSIMKNGLLKGLAVEPVLKMSVKWGHIKQEY